MYPCFSQYYPGGISNTNLKIWLDANDATTLTVASGKVSQWNDKSGTGVNVTQATSANQPAYTTNQINGMPIIQTDGSSTYLGGTFAVNGLNQISMLAVATPSTITSTLANPYSVNYPIFYWGMETGTGWGQIGLNLNNVSTATFYNFGWRFGTSQASSDVFYNPAATPSGAKVMAAAHLNTVEKGYYNGFNITTPVAGYSLTSKLTTIANTPNTFFVGHGQNPYGGNGYGGNNKIGEILFYNVNLSNTQLIILQNYLAAKWGVTLLTNSYFTPPSATTFNYNLIGVGRESSSDSVAFTRSNDGIGFRVGNTSTDFLKNHGDYIMAAHTNPLIAGVATVHLPAGTVQSWADEWYLVKSDSGSNGGNLNIFFSSAGYFGGAGSNFGTAANYQLLYRASTGATNYTVLTATPSVSGAYVSFAVSAANISNGYYTLGTTNTTTSPLPIELTSFDAKCNSNNVAINWTTASEINNDYFNIERSRDAINFADIAKIAGAGNSSSIRRYSYIDSNPFNGIGYYRLKQTDFNGQSQSFDWVSTNCNKESAFVFNAYCNQSNGLVIDLQSQNEDSYTAILYDNNGRIIVKNNYSVSIGNNNYLMDISTISSGIYYLTIGNGQNNFSRKISIQK